eukprot:1103992-Prymnesium_polylepis.1
MGGRVSKSFRFLCVWRLGVGTQRCRERAVERQAGCVRHGRKMPPVRVLRSTERGGAKDQRLPPLKSDSEAQPVQFQRRGGHGRRSNVRAIGSEAEVPE